MTFDRRAYYLANRERWLTYNRRVREREKKAEAVSKLWYGGVNEIHFLRLQAMPEPKFIRAVKAVIWGRLTLTTNKDSLYAKY